MLANSLHTSTCLLPNSDHSGLYFRIIVFGQQVVWYLAVAAMMKWGGGMGGVIAKTCCCYLAAYRHVTYGSTFIIRDCSVSRESTFRASKIPHQLFNPS